MISALDYQKNAISVRQLNFYVKSLLEGDKRLVSCLVMGEVSNFKRHFSSGHCYFTLKDDFAAVKCIMFKASASRLNFDINDGMKIICKGKISLYERDGSYQFYVDFAEPEGIGAKALALQELKQKLLEEGLFDPSNKRALPKYPQKIAVVTSSGGAALQDIINVITRRYPLCELIVAGASVQGEKAIGELITALDRLYEIDSIDTVIIGRGGGSNEDLDAFNNEILARKIFESPFPVVSAVGHETDVTICDLVADMRAPTPSAAAELTVPDMQQIIRRYNLLLNNIINLCEAKINLSESKLSALSSSFSKAQINAFFEKSALSLDTLTEKIVYLFNNKLNCCNQRFSEVALKIDSMSPLKVLSRGYSVVQKNGKTVSRIGEVNVDDEICIRLSDGEVDCCVTNRRSV